MKKPSWNKIKSDEVFNISGWGSPYFSINRHGDVAVHPRGKKNRSFSLKILVDQIIERSIQTPFLLRFNDILLHRLACIKQAFETSISEYDYKGGHSIIYPIKVNQQRHVVERIADFNQKNNNGLEAGSKPELLAIMALSRDPKTPIVCNGYKDEEYFEIALMGMKIGKQIYPVIEKYSEFETLIKVSKKLNINPEFGVRIKLSTKGSGRWQKSGGFRSKFGLTINEVVKGVGVLKKAGLLDGFKLLHFHQGSQITNISTIKSSLKEAGRVYVELIKLGVPLSILDVGGGLGVDYNGTGTNDDSSANYTLQEYANDIIFQVKEICDEAGIDHPTIFTESGRAVAAHHSVLVFEVLGFSGYDRSDLPTKTKKAWTKPLKELFEIRQALKWEKDSTRTMEHYHDSVSNFQECQNLFGLGYMNIEERGLAEEFYFSSLKRCLTILEKDEEYKNEVADLEETLSDT
ncbi:MAG TPA: biosynthetic arginine decarboxylase, partial [bacterium]|nr:biosynthetic arginine decarboxylase [bacterium]